MSRCGASSLAGGAAARVGRTGRRDPRSHRARNRDQHRAWNDTRRGASSGPACVRQRDPGPGRCSRRLDVDVARAGASGSPLRRAHSQELARSERDCGRLDCAGDRHQHHDLFDDQCAGDAARARRRPRRAGAGLRSPNDRARLSSAIRTTSITGRRPRRCNR